MSSLTEQERIGLEEVFLSISKQGKDSGRVHTLKRQLQAIWKRSIALAGLKKPSKLLFQASKRINFPNFHHLIPKKNKKKKNLS